MTERDKDRVAGTVRLYFSRRKARDTGGWGLSHYSASTAALRTQYSLSRKWTPEHPAGSLPSTGS